MEPTTNTSTLGDRTRSGQPPDEGGARQLRADAQRNLQLILAAARAVFARRGLEATLDEVAREAGLGVGTVYRRFRDKHELAEALFEDNLQLLVAEAEAAGSEEDPWEAFVSFLERFLERQARDCGLRDFVSTAGFGEDRLVKLKLRLRPAVERIVQRAQAAGRLRADFDSHDIAVIAVMLGAVEDFTRGVRPECWRRYLAMILDGVQCCEGSGAGSPLAEPPLGEGEIEAAMASWRPRH
jgi:AcrR family transcriptional regulator